jgi:arginyl-tRNA synthetase
MNAKIEIKKSIEEALDSLGYEKVDFDIEIPKDTTHGDLSTNIAMKLAKSLSKNPMEVAENIITNYKLRITNEEGIIKDIAVAKPGFINFTFSDEYLRNALGEVLKEKDNFGNSEENKGKTFLIEHTSPNPNKEFHLGHLKNNVTGLAVSYLFEAVGTKVFRDAIDNNRGIAIAKLMWGYLKFGKKDGSVNTDVVYWLNHQDEWHTPETLPAAKGKPDRLMDLMYTKASDDFKNSEEVESEVRQLVLDWENFDAGVETSDKHKATWALWEKTQEWVWKGYERSIGRVNGFKFDKIWHEHELYKKGREHILKGLEMGVFKKTEDGAVVSDLSKEFKIPDTILIKKDGTSLYITQDIELTKLKRETFNPDEMFWVIGPEQSLAMKQMFAVCSQLGFGKYEDYHHLPYGFVSIRKPDGKVSKMSSRDGTAIYVDDLIDQAKDKIKEEVRKKKEEEIEDSIIETIAIGAIKYALLKVSRTTDQVFDFDTTVSFEGDSGPYVMYAYVRALKLLKSASYNEELGIRNEELKESVLQDEERLLIKKILNFPETVKEAAKTYAPNLICLYVYDLAQTFSSFYANCRVVDEPEQDLKNARLQLVLATSVTLKNALKLVGIQVVEKM